jgi:hypothetical protein
VPGCEFEIDWEAQRMPSYLVEIDYRFRGFNSFEDQAATIDTEFGYIPTKANLDMAIARRQGLVLMAGYITDLDNATTTWYVGTPFDHTKIDDSPEDPDRR